MINTKNIILIASITAVLGFGVVALQTNTVAVDALMDNASEILDIGEKSEITTLAPPPGKGKTKSSSLVGVGGDISGFNTIKCSASNILKCTIKNSNLGLYGVELLIDKVRCDFSVTDGSSRASVDTRKSEEACDYLPSLTYSLKVLPMSMKNSAPNYIEFTVSFTADSIVITEVPNSI